jgi:hypothetical protein
MVHEAGQEPAQLAAVGGGQGFEQRVLRRPHLRLQPLERVGPGRRQAYDVAAAVALVADARHEAVALELVEHRVQVAAIDPQAAAELGLARRALLVEGEHDSEVLAAVARLAERVGDEAAGIERDLAEEPARQDGEALRSVHVAKPSRGIVGVATHRVISLVTPTISLSKGRLMSQVQQLTDRQAIADLVSGLGAWLDDKRFDDARSVLAEDVTVDTPGGAAQGIDRVVAQARRNHEGYETHHVITNVLVDLAGDQATARANLTVTFASPETRFAMGERYRFEAVRTPDGWRLTRIRVRPVWSTRE